MKTRLGVPAIGRLIETTSGRKGRVIKNECRSRNPITKGDLIPGLFLYEDADSRVWFGLSGEWGYVSA